MRFQFEQRFRAPVEEVEAVFVDADFYLELARLPGLAPPDMLDQRVEGHLVHQRVRYRFNGELSSAARRVLDPDRLTWVEESTLDTRAHFVQFRMVADHYADRFRCAGLIRYLPIADETCRMVSGDLVVSVPFVGRAVERAIVSGLIAHLRDEVSVVERWLARPV